MRPLVWLLLGPRIAPPVLLARPSLLIANHLTAFDVPVILYALSARDRDHVAVAMSGQLLTGWRRGKAERHRMVAPLTPIAYWLVTALFNVFPLPRGAGLRQSFAHAGEAWTRVIMCWFFPKAAAPAMGGYNHSSRASACWRRSPKCRCSRSFARVSGCVMARSGRNAGTVAVRLGDAVDHGRRGGAAELSLGGCRLRSLHWRITDEASTCHHARRRAASLAK